MVEHRQEIIEFETYLGVAQVLRKKIEQAVDKEWLEAIKSPTLGFTHLTPKAMLDHLRANGAELNDSDVAALVMKLYAPWDLSENPATKFARDDKLEKQLTKKNIAPQPAVCLCTHKSGIPSHRRVRHRTQGL